MFPSDVVINRNGVAPSAADPALTVIVKGTGSGGGTLTRNAPYSSVAITTTPASLADVLISPALAGTRGGVMRNADAAATMFVGFGVAAVTTANAAYAILPGGSEPIDDGYEGDIRAIWAGAAVTGNSAVQRLFS